MYFIGILCILFIYIIKNSFKYNCPIIISIEGNIGSGKSTLINNMKSKFKDIIFLDEPVNEWIKITDENNNNILYNFYNDKNRWAYTFQNFAFITRAKLLYNAIKNNKTRSYEKRKVIITERSVETDKNVFARMLFDSKNINQLEYNLYNEWYNYLFSSIKINNIVYLRSNYNIAYDRILNRNRNEESTIDKDYIKTVHEYHDSWLTNKNLTNINYNICYINVNEEKTEEIMNSHIEKIIDFIDSL